MFHLDNDIIIYARLVYENGRRWIAGVLGVIIDDLFLLLTRVGVLILYCHATFQADVVALRLLHSVDAYIELS